MAGAVYFQGWNNKTMEIYCQQWEYNVQQIPPSIRKWWLGTSNRTHRCHTRAEAPPRSWPRNKIWNWWKYSFYNLQYTRWHWNVKGTDKSRKKQKRTVLILEKKHSIFLWPREALKKKGEKYLGVTWPIYAGRTTRDDLFVDSVGCGVADLLVELEAGPGITMGIRPGLFLGHNKLPT